MRPAMPVPGPEPAREGAATPAAPASSPATWPTPLQAARRVLRFFTAGDPVLFALQLVLIVYYFTTRGIFEGKASGDGMQGFQFLPGVLLHRTFDLAVTQPQAALMFGREPSGLVANLCPIGPVFLWLPTYLAGLLWQKLLLVLAHTELAALLELRPRAITGRGEFDYFMAGLGSLLAGLVGIRLTFQLVQRRLGQGAARFGTVLAVLATPLTWYLVTQPLYQHAAAFFAVTLLVERWDAWRGQMTTRRWAALGALTGVAMLMRPQEGLFALLPGLDAAAALLVALRARDGRAAGRILLHGLLFVLLMVVVFLPQALLWKHYYGEIRTPQPPGHFRFRDPAIVEALFSMRAGLFPWVPVLYLAVPGLVWARRRLGGLALRLGLLFALELWLNASVWDYHGSWAFGPRRYTDAVVIAALGLGGFWACATARRSAARGVVVRYALVLLACLAVAWNGLLMELVRTRRVKSSSAGAYPLSVWARWAKAPAWLVQRLERVSYPFVQPAGWIYGLVHHLPARTFEAVVGNYLLERDWLGHRVMWEPALYFADSPFVVEGLAPPPPPPPSSPSSLAAWPPRSPVPCASRVRLLVPLMGKEPLRLRLYGALQAGESSVRVFWNGVPLPTRPGLDTVSFDVPEELVHTRSRTNELTFTDLPAGARLIRLDLESFTPWWLR
jgi:hypothetical protein